MNQEAEQLPPFSKKQLGIIAGVIATIILIVIVIASNQQPKSLVDTTSGKIETAYIGIIQATINVYYTDKGHYPSSYEDLIEYKPEDKADLEKYQTNLKDFEYTRRGDEQAYKITYTNIDKKTITVEGNYKEDYN
jgi:hypothetical protein